MYWADKVAQEIISSGKYKPYWVDDMKTPSGQIHVGSLRGVLVHDFIYKSLIHEGIDAKFTYVFEDHDPLDEISHNLDRKEWEKYLGQPLFTVPSPDGDKEKNFAQHFSLEFKDVFNSAGANPEIIWVSDLYKSGRMNDGIKKCLDNADIIRSIYEELYKKPLPKNWYPFKMVCPQCGKEATTDVTNWDGQEVTFSCEIEGISWTNGCGFSGKASPFSGDGKYVGKLPWKVEWPVKWQVIGVTIEGAGKDHMSAGGSHDVAKLICERVLDYSVPFPLAYEFFLIGGKKMSSSKGLGTPAIEIAKILPNYLVRFLFARTDYRQAIEFNPQGTMAIPDLFDEYDRCYNRFTKTPDFSLGDAGEAKVKASAANKLRIGLSLNHKNTADSKPAEAYKAYIDSSDETLARTFEMSHIGEFPPKEKTFLPRFRDVVNYLQQPTIDLYKKFEEIKGRSLNGTEEKILKDREKYGKIWLENYAPIEFKIQLSDKIPEQAKGLSEGQKKYLTKVIDLIEDIGDGDELQQALYNLSKEMGINTKEAFSAIYLVTIGKEFGPKAGHFLLQYPKEKIITRFQEATGDLFKS
ncbi:lysine--tRNA ligase [Candidatus Daviesbacteria bacterium]|nr:lysine--tRNA ligase [Candidatus Daviesbacteria bacterium]